MARLWDAIRESAAHAGAVVRMPTSQTAASALASVAATR
jgi:hypothetical protein